MRINFEMCLMNFAALLRLKRSFRYNALCNNRLSIGVHSVQAPFFTGGRRVEPHSKFSKSLTGSQFSEGVAERG